MDIEWPSCRLSASISVQKSYPWHASCRHSEILLSVRVGKRGYWFPLEILKSIFMHVKWFTAVLSELALLNFWRCLLLSSHFLHDWTVKWSIWSPVDPQLKDAALRHPLQHLWLELSDLPHPPVLTASGSSLAQPPSGPSTPLPPAGSELGTARGSPSTGTPQEVRSPSTGTPQKVREEGGEPMGLSGRAMVTFLTSPVSEGRTQLVGNSKRKHGDQTCLSDRPAKTRRPTMLSTKQKLPAVYMSYNMQHDSKFPFVSRIQIHPFETF